MIPKSSVADAFRTPTRDQALAFRFGFEDGTRVRWGREAYPLNGSLDTWDRECAAPFLCAYMLALILAPRACEGCYGRGWAPSNHPTRGVHPCPICDGRKVAVERTEP
jgi:hypothetical protein